MLKCQRKHVCGHVCARSIRSILQPYSEYLTSQGFSKGRHRRHVRVVEHFGRWIGRRHVSWSLIQEFLDHDLPNCQCPGVSRDRRLNRAALNHLLAMLGLDREPPTFRQGCLGKLLRRYEEHLATARGLAPDTVQRHLKYTQDMLRRFGTRRESQFKHWTSELIEEYLSREGHSAPARGRNIGWCARSFLRFLLQEGLIARDLAAGVPTVARWRLASLPTTLCEEEIRHLLGAADLTTPLGQRDYAIALCMSELGLRGADVANLEIEGIDFAAGVLRLSQRKERQADVFPMTRRLRSALEVYLRDGRPACPSATVFVRHHAPLGKSLTSTGICHVVLRLADQAGLRHRVRGTHTLRRSFASRMLEAGATLKQIADFLGHASIDTTTLYAKVDLATLSRVALPWPTKERKAVHS
jgi:site-specific recombinase XerD